MAIIKYLKRLHSTKKQFTGVVTEEANMKKKKVQLLRIIIVGVLMLAVSWLAYWIGYISNKPAKDAIMQMEEKKYEYINGQHVPVGADTNKAQQSDQAVADKLRRDKQVADNVYIVGGKAKANEARNKVNQINSKEHAIGIHQSHAGRISQSINKEEKDKAEKDKNQSPVKKVPRKGSKISDIVGESNIIERSRTKFRKRPSGGVELKESDTIRQMQEKLLGVKIIDKVSEKRIPKVHIKPAPKQTYYVLRHAETASRVHGEIHQKLRVMDATIPKEAYIFHAKKLPKNRNLMPSVANGHVGTLVHSPDVFMNGMYSGYKSQSHRGAIPSTCSLNITGTIPESNFTRNYTLNVGEGIYTEISSSEYYTLYQRVYAHRNLTRLLVVELDLIRTEVTLPLKLKVDLNRWTSSRDFTFLQYDDIPDHFKETSYKVGTINAPESDSSGHLDLHILYDHVPKELVPPSGILRTKWVFLTSIGSSRQEVFDAYQEGMRLARSNDQLYAQHVEAWAHSWSKARIDIDGNLKLARAVYGSWYYILSSMPLREDQTSPFIGLSPSGLPRGDFSKDYHGHIFWDQEISLFPSILMFHPDLAKVLLRTRARTYKAASKNARKNDKKGAQYPWASGLTGMELSRKKNVTKQYVHVTGDVAFALRQYLHATQDAKLLTVDGYQVIARDIANFWASRLTYNMTAKRFEIKDVVPPDDLYKHVNNSVYTNVVAKLALELPAYIEGLLPNITKRENPLLQFAKEMYIPFDSHLKYHPEFDGYRRGSRVQQADAILLGYPLLHSMSDEIRNNDLTIYQQVTDPTAPAMTWAMYAINWLELKEFDKARIAFNKMFYHIRNEFQVWTERTVGGAVNYISGMGSFLQAILFGYGGVRLHQDRLDIDPVLPPDSEGMHFIGVHYLGSTLDIHVHDDDILITKTKQQGEAPPLTLYTYKSQEIHHLALGKPIKIKHGRAAIRQTSLGEPDGQLKR